MIPSVLRHWNGFERTDVGEVGEQARDELARFLAGPGCAGARFVERRAKNRSRV